MNQKYLNMASFQSKTGLLVAYTILCPGLRFLVTAMVIDINLLKTDLKNGFKNVTCSTFLTFLALVHKISLKIQF